jgi:hypothetical protein
VAEHGNAADLPVGGPLTFGARQLRLATEGERLRNPRWPIRGLLILVAGLAGLCTGIVKWRRYAELRQRIANYSGHEKRLMGAYQELSRIRSPCGNIRVQCKAYRAVAAERRRLREVCEREIWRIW